MTPAELEALAVGVAKLAFVFGLAGGIVLQLVLWGAQGLVLLLGSVVDRHARIAACRRRARERHEASSMGPAMVAAPARLPSLSPSRPALAPQ